MAGRPALVANAPAARRTPAERPDAGARSVLGRAGRSIRQHALLDQRVKAERYSLPLRAAQPRDWESQQSSARLALRARRAARRPAGAPVASAGSARRAHAAKVRCRAARRARWRRCRAARDPPACAPQSRGDGLQPQADRRQVAQMERAWDQQRKDVARDQRRSDQPNDREQRPSCARPGKPENSSAAKPTTDVASPRRTVGHNR